MLWYALMNYPSFILFVHKRVWDLSKILKDVALSGMCTFTFYNSGRKQSCRPPVRVMHAHLKSLNVHHLVTVFFFQFCNFSKLPLLVPFFLFLIPNSTISKIKLSVSQGNWLSAPLKCLTSFSPISAGLFWPLKVWAVMGWKGFSEDLLERTKQIFTHTTSCWCVYEIEGHLPLHLVSSSFFALCPIPWRVQILSLLACVSLFLSMFNFIAWWHFPRAVKKDINVDVQVTTALPKNADLSMPVLLLHI